MARAVNWCFTLFDAPPPSFCSDMKYLCYGEELCPDTRRRHLQGYVQFVKRRTLRMAKAYIGVTAHMEIAKGSPWQNRTYCSKDGQFTEFGEVPRDTSKKKLSDVVITALREGYSMRRLFEESPEAALRFCNQFTKIRLQLIEPYSGPRTVFWFYGLTGTGKTRAATELFPDAPIVTLEGYYVHNYNGEKTVIIDELRPGDIQFNVLLRLTDRYAGSARVLYGNVGWACDTIVVTCPVHPRDFATSGGADRIDQLLRRVSSVVYFKGGGERTIEYGCDPWSSAGGGGTA